MAEQSFQEKTEQATPKKLEEARKKGQVAKSKELSSIAVLAAATAYLFFQAEGQMKHLGHFLKRAFLNIPAVASEELPLVETASQGLISILQFSLPIMVVLVVVAFMANILQAGFILSVDPLTPKASKLNPVEGLKRILSKRSLVELAKSIGKFVIVGWAAGSTLKKAFENLVPLIYQEAPQIMGVLGQEAINVLIKCCWVILILAFLDFFYQRWEHAENLKMTKQEVRDEHKQTEGDPHVKGRIRAIQRETARKRMMEEVPKADVVITNPTRLAVALRYDPGKAQAPVVVAKGARIIAARIRELAEQHGVPLVENRPLAQNLYNLEVGQEIPAETYQAVAEILAYVYGLKQKSSPQARTP